MKKLLLWVITVLTIFFFIGCSEDNNDGSTTSVPYDPTSQMLEDGPEAGKVFVNWSALGLQRASAVNNSITGWCYQGQDASIDIPFMCGLHVPATALAVDSLNCQLDIVDTIYSQTEYLPSPYTFADSVVYWQDTTCVEIPNGLTAADIQFYWYNREDGTFFAVPTILVGDRWKAKTLHFSRYILGQRRGAN